MNLYYLYDSLVVSLLIVGISDLNNPFRLRRYDLLDGFWDGILILSILLYYLLLLLDERLDYGGPPLWGSTVLLLCSVVLRLQ